MALSDGRLLVSPNHVFHVVSSITKAGLYLVVNACSMSELSHSIEINVSL